MTTLPSQQGRGSQAKRAWIKRATVALPLLCLLIFGTFIGVRLVSNATGANAATLASIKGQVPPLVKTSTVLGQTDTNQSLSLSVGLKLRNADSLKAFVDSSSHAKSINAHQHLTQSEIAAAYAPLDSSQQSVIAYMQSYGFQVTSTSKLHLLIDFQGTVSDAENAFHIQINNYRSLKGQTFYAPASDPSVPLDLAALIQNVAGLSNSINYSHLPVTKSKSANPKVVTANNSNCSTQGGFTPNQITTAYNLTSLYNAGFSGEGQTIALFELDDYQQSDISNYTSCFGGSKVPINRISVDKGAGGPGVGAVEVELDMEMILSAAPHLAALNVYEAPKPGVLTEAQYLDLWHRIITDDTASVISTSWGSCEEANTAADLQAEDNLFAIAAAQGQTIFAAAGDHGTNDCQIPLSSNQTKFSAVDDPASQPYVTGVGGTSLALNGNNAYGSEAVWNEGYDSTIDLVWASGGGISSAWHMPSWQQGPGVNNSFTSSGPCASTSVDGGTGNCREVPDVALDSALGTGYAMYCTVNASCGGAGWFPVGGTSAAAPMWAAFMALVNEKTLHDGGFNIGFLNPYLYQIDQGASGTSYANDFHDITTGNNDGLNDGGTTYPATANYDMATGLGSYNALNLANDLETLANAKNGSRGAPAALKWYFAEGSVGGSFTEFLTVLNPSTQSATVTATYLFQNQPAKSVSHVVPANSRGTWTANTDLGIATNGPHLSISTILSSTVPVVAERPLYFNGGGINSGTDVLGATSVTNTSFYFAAGDSSNTSTDVTHEFLTVLNPNSTAVTITANFYSGGKQVDSTQITIPSMQRGTLGPNNYHGKAAIQITASQGVVVERPIYIYGNTIPNLSAPVFGAASTVGATSPGNDWLFAEGHTAAGTQEYLVLANFTTSPVNATVKLEYTNGTVQTVPQTIGPLSQDFFDVNNANAHPNCGLNGNPACTVTSSVSAEVTSSNGPIVAERVMYFYSGPVGHPVGMGMTDVVGASASQTTYSFAEGHTVSTTSNWLSIQNPNGSSEVVAVTFFADNTIVEKEMTLPAHSRTTIYINGVIVPITNAYPAPGANNVSVVVQAFSGTVVVERPIYFNDGKGSVGATDIIGYTGN